MRYVMGIDNGGTGTKAAIYDLNGYMVAQARQDTCVISKRSGWCERDMEELWEVNCNVIKEAVRLSGACAEQIAGVSFSGHGKGLYLWGKNGKPVRNGIVSTDSRADSIVKEWDDNGTCDAVYPYINQSVLASQPCALLRWLELNELESAERTQWVFGVKDYVRYRMTGQANLEMTDFSGSGLMDLTTKKLSPKVLALYGLEGWEHCFPDIIDSTMQCGSITKEAAEATGLACGTPVAGGLFDIDACAIAMAVTRTDQTAVIAGTWSINEYISSSPVTDRSVKMNSLYCIDNYYLVEESSPTSASNQLWFLRNFLQEAAQVNGQNLYDYANELVLQAPIDEACITYLPFLYGGCDDASARAVFMGLEARHSRADVVRAIYEGVVFGHRMQIERLKASRTDEMKQIRLAGGVVHSPIWVQMFADALGMNVEIIETDELGALGAAMCATVAAGIYDDLVEASSQMVRVGTVYYPDWKRKSIYDQKYAQFYRIHQSMRSQWSLLHAAEGEK